MIRANPGTFVEQKPIIQFWAQCRDGGTDCSPSGQTLTLPPGTTDPANGQSSVLFNNIFRNIDIDSNVGATAGGQRNTGAIGIAFPGAQGSAIEDSTITMTDGNGNHSYMGIRNIPGQSGGIYNVTVKGGQYGLWMDRETRFGMAVGLRLYDQETLAIQHTANNKLVVIGFHITRQATGRAVWIDNGPKVDPLPAFGTWSGIAMVDGVIQNTGGAVIDVKNRPIYLKNVRIGSAGVATSDLVLTGTTLTLQKPTGAAWQQVDEWAYVSKTAASGVPYSLVNSTLASNNTLGLVEEDDIDPSASPGNAGVVTATYVTPHLWSIDDLPSFEDDDSIIVLAKRFNENTVDPLLKPTMARPRVFLGGSGRHPIDSTVSIGTGRALAGLDRVHTVIETQSTPTRSADLWCASVPMITTSNSATSNAAFGRVSLAEFRDCTEFTPVEWRAGAASSMHAVMLTVSDRNVDPGFKGDANQAGFRFTGNGGGQHWGDCKEFCVCEPYDAVYFGRDVWPRRTTMGFRGSCWIS